jgi:16S rRNA (guanine966-N2)-methyltransferase
LRFRRENRLSLRDSKGIETSCYATQGAQGGRALRIIAGERRGAKIFAPKGVETRPTGDRVREAAFSLIGPVDGASVLDLFAGSGAMGLEALSRAAARAVFVESDPEACRTIERNLDKLRLRGARVVCGDVLRVLATEQTQYDLVLVDPPYRMFSTFQPGLAAYLPRALAPDGLVVVETSAKEHPELPLAERTSRRYGSARLTLFQHPA